MTRVQTSQLGKQHRIINLMRTLCVVRAYESWLGAPAESGQNSSHLMPFLSGCSVHGRKQQRNHGIDVQMFPSSRFGLWLYAFLRCCGPLQRTTRQPPVSAAVASPRSRSGLVHSKASAGIRRFCTHPKRSECFRATQRAKSKACVVQAATFRRAQGVRHSVPGASFLSRSYLLNVLADCGRTDRGRWHRRTSTLSRAAAWWLGRTGGRRPILFAFQCHNLRSVAGIMGTCIP
jgi:hypothetical protein